MRNENELLELMPVPKAFLKLALPAIAAQLINILYNLVDKMFIGHIEGAEKVMRSCTWMLIVLSVILTVIMLLFGKNILQLFGASNDTIIYAVDYMNIYCLVRYLHN